MSNRNLTTTQIAANTAQSVSFHEILYIRTRESGLSSFDYTYLSNAPFNISLTSAQAAAIGLDEPGAREFLAVGPFLQFSSIEESADFQITNLTVSLAGMRPEDLVLFLENQYIDQPIKIWRCWFDGDGIMVGNPVQIFDGRIDKPVINDDPASGVVIGCSAASQFVDFQRTAGRHTNNSEQTHFFPGDTGFKFSADVIKDLKWGG